MLSSSSYNHWRTYNYAYIDFNLKFTILFSILIHLNNLSLLSVCCCCFCPVCYFSTVAQCFSVLSLSLYLSMSDSTPHTFSTICSFEWVNKWMSVCYTCHVFRVLCMFCWAFLCTKSYSTGNYIQNVGNSSFFFRIPVDLFLAFTSTHSRCVHPFFIVCVFSFFFAYALA